MSDQQFHEIQLSGKQLVFLFMSAVVLAVVVFLLGVSVGRGVHDATVATAASDPSVPGDTTVSTTPPPTEPARGELSYHNALQAPAGSKPPAVEPPAPPPDAAPPKPAEPAAEPPANLKARPEPPPQPKVDRPVETKPKPASLPAASASGAWVVQVMALRSKDTADKLSKDLQAKGFAAFVVNPDGGLFRVRVGPFAKRADAEGTASRLVKEGHKPSVQAR